jgi:Lantibiotic dehydratase, N terminus
MASTFLPLFVGRLAGRSAACLENLRATETLAISAALLEVEAEMQPLAAELTAALFSLAGRPATAPRSRGAIVELRRDIHNARQPDRRRLDALADALPARIAAACDAFHALAVRRDQLRAAAERSFARESAAIRGRFQALLRDDLDFQQGLLLSSRTLSAHLDRYLAAPPAGLRSKDAQLERGLMRYFSRMVMKATPFATFCAVAPGRIRDDLAGAGTTFALRADPAIKISAVRLNKNLRLALADRLQGDPSVRGQLPIELTPGLELEGRSWVFLAQVDGRETFQHLPVVPGLDGLAGWLRHRRVASHDDVVERLLERRQFGDRSRAVAYVDRLLAIGFLRFRPLTAELDADWDLTLRQFLAASAAPAARSVAALLASLRRWALAYPRAGLEQRRRLLSRAEDALRAHFAIPDAGVPPPLKGLVFYEDATTPARLSIARRPLAEAEAHLTEYLRFAAQLTPQREEQARMRAYFERRHPDGAAVPLRRFAEGYCRDYFGDYVDRARASFGVNPPQPTPPEPPAFPGDAAPLALVDAIRHAGTVLADRLRQRWREAPEAEELVVERDDFEAALAGVPAPADLGRSVTVFGHLLPGFTPRHGHGLLFNSCSLGHGKYFSRFLYLLPREFTRTLRARHRGRSRHLLAEICCDADYNANLHPPLLPAAVQYPTAGRVAAAHPLETFELMVEPDPDDPFRLRLTHPRHRPPIVPVDLGFENPTMRPPLFQLLCLFTPAAGYRLPLPESLAPAAAPADDAVHCRPRITYRRTVVLARRRWLLSAPAFPGRQPGEGEAEYFLRIDRWRRAAAIPREVYVSIKPGPPPAPAPGAPPAGSATPPATGGARASRAARQHLYKPQYIDFANPLLVDLFSRLPGPAEAFTAILSERLPRREHLPTRHGDPWVTDLILQLDLAPAPAPGAPRQ